MISAVSSGEKATIPHEFTDNRMCFVLRLQFLSPEVFNTFEENRGVSCSDADTSALMPGYSLGMGLSGA
jgi:hypothetical protein